MGTLFQVAEDGSRAGPAWHLGVAQKQKVSVMGQGRGGGCGGWVSVCVHGRFSFIPLVGILTSFDKELLPALPQTPLWDSPSPLHYVTEGGRPAPAAMPRAIPMVQRRRISWRCQPMGLSLASVSDEHSPWGQPCHSFPHVNTHLSMTPLPGPGTQDESQPCLALE